MRLTTFGVVVASFVALMTPAAAQTVEEVNGRIETVFGEYEAFAEAFEAVQAAVAEGDAETFAEWVYYPITVAATGDGEEVTLEGPEDVVARYDDFMTDEIIEAITNQRYEDLFVNGGGVMFGNGELWLGGVCTEEGCTAFDVKIITIQSAPG